MSHEEKTSKSGMVIPFILVILAVTFLILVSSVDKPRQLKEETKTETPAH